MWVRQVREGKTYHGRPKAVGDLYLIHEDEVDNIVHGLKFAIIEPPPPMAVRERVALAPVTAAPTPPPESAPALPPPPAVTAAPSPIKVMTATDMPAKPAKPIKKKK